MFCRQKTSKLYLPGPSVILTANAPEFFRPGPGETNSKRSENRALPGKKELPIGNHHFKGELLVSGRVGGDFKLFRCWCCLDG